VRLTEAHDEGKVIEALLDGLDDKWLKIASQMDLEELVLIETELDQVVYTVSQ
jgi:hypothetical protein